MNVISVPRPATEPSMKTLLNLVMGLSKHLECTGQNEPYNGIKFNKGF